MTEQPTDFERLMERVRTGCPEAARELFEEYGGHIRLVVRRKMNRRLRSQYDSTDFTQAVWASFFTTSAEQFRFDTPEELVAFLAGMANNKLTEAYRNRVSAAKRDAGREQHFELGENDEVIIPRDPRQPTPSQVLVAKEEWERLIEGLPSHYRLALELLRRGHTHAEVAERLDLSAKTIQRLLKRLDGDLADHA